MSIFLGNRLKNTSVYPQRKTNSLGFGRLNANNIERELNKIVQKYSEKNVILGVKDGFISRFTMQVADNPKKRIGMSLTGDSGSGKSTIAREVLKALPKIHPLGKPPVTVVNGDNFFKDASRKVKAAGGDFSKFLDTHNFDIPQSVNLAAMRNAAKRILSGKMIRTPKYVFDVCNSIPNSIPRKPGRLNIFDSLFSMQPKVKEVMDVSTYVHVPKKTMEKRWFDRAKIRGPEDPAAKQKLFNMVDNAADEHIRPLKKQADIVINGEAPIEEFGAMAKDIFKIFSPKN